MKLEVGGKWVYRIGLETSGLIQDSKTDNVVTAREEVVVPAGTFDAYRVDYQIESRVRGQTPSTVSGSQWFAPGAGLVKSISVMDMPEENVTAETRIELVSRRSK